MKRCKGVVIQKNDPHQPVRACRSEVIEGEDWCHLHRISPEWHQKMRTLLVPGWDRERSRRDHKDRAFNLLTRRVRRKR